MKPVPTSSALFSAGPATNPLRLLAILALLAACARSGVADDEFQDLVKQIPRSANAVVLLNMEKAKNSPLGQKEDFKGSSRGVRGGDSPGAAASDAIRHGLGDRL